MLSYSRLGREDGSATHVVMLHGIYGRGRNLQAVARALVEARPDVACWLVDLPYHGDSGPGAHGETVAGLAADVADWLSARTLAPHALLGHSYGGKVVLALAAGGLAGLRQAWIVDSTPEVKPPSGGAWDMLRIVRAGPTRFASRDEAVALIAAGGFPLSVGQWMATNLVRDDGGFVWRLDFDVMARLLEDFFTTDLWPVVELPPAGVELHFIKASESSAISEDAAARLEAAAAGGRVHLHHRTGGHWIHAESPEVVAALLAESV
ncbi:MAG: alpha/beta hydrolase [Acidobacteriota bacterium]